MILSIVRREIQSLINEKVALALFIILPLLMIFIIRGYFVDVQYKVGIVNLDQGAKVSGQQQNMGTRLSSVLGNQADVKWVMYKSTAQVKALMDDNYIVGYIVLPKNFTTTFVSQSTPHIDAYLGNHDSQVYNSVYTSLTNLFQDNASVNSQLKSQVEAIITFHYPYNNQKLSQADYTMPLAIPLVASIFTVLFSSLLFLRAKKSGLIEKLKGKKVEINNILLGYSTAYFLLAFLEIVLMLILSKIIFKLDVLGNMGVLLLVYALIQLFSVVLGIFLASVIFDELYLVLTALFVMLGQGLLTGIFKPINLFPDIWAKIIKLLPLNNGINIAGLVSSEGQSLNMYPWHIIVLVLFIVVFYVLAYVAMDWNTLQTRFKRS